MNSQFSSTGEADNQADRHLDRQLETSAETQDQPPSADTPVQAYQWQDSVWLERRELERPGVRPVSIYRMFPSAWQHDSAGRPLDWKTLASRLVPYVADLGFTHIELKGVSLDQMGHEFAVLIDQCHLGGIGVVLESRPGSGGPGDDSLSQLLNSIDQFHLDGVRVEPAPPAPSGQPDPKATAEWVQAISSSYPDLLLLLEPGDWPDQDTPRPVLTWNRDWCKNLHTYLAAPPETRGDFHGILIDGLRGAFDQQYVLSLTDDGSSTGEETWLGRMPGDRWQQFANLRACLGFMWAHPGKKLLDMGTEFAQHQAWGRAGRLDWGLLGDPAHSGVFRLVTDLNRIYMTEPALHLHDFEPNGLGWVVDDDTQNSVLAFLRYGDEGMAPMLAVINFTPEVHHEYRLGVPATGVWRELLNSDSTYYGGSNTGNGSGVQADTCASHGYPASLSLTLPPLAILLLQQEDWPA